MKYYIYIKMMRSVFDVVSSILSQNSPSVGQVLGILNPVDLASSSTGLIPGLMSPGSQQTGTGQTTGTTGTTGTGVGQITTSQTGTSRPSRRSICNCFNTCNSSIDNLPTVQNIKPRLYNRQYIPRYEKFSSNSLCSMCKDKKYIISCSITNKYCN